MKLKRIVSVSLAAMIALSCLTLSVFAAPYQNYTWTESGIYAEPQAYVPSEVYDSTTIGLDQLEGKALSSPSDLLQFEDNGMILISDTDNNRIVVLKDDMTTVAQIINFASGESDTFNAPNGLFILESKNLLYICDSNNKRIVRFAYDEASEQFVFDRTFDDPDISFTSEQAAEGPSDDDEPETTPEVTATPEAPAEATATPEAPAEATATPEAPAEATATPEAPAEATATPEASPEATATPEVVTATVAPAEQGNEATQAPVENVTPAPGEPSIAPGDPTVAPEGGEVTPAPEGGEETPAPEGGEETPVSEGEEDPTQENEKGSSDATDITYKPLKIVVDEAERMFVVSKNCYLGIVELSKDGEFTKFFGTTKTKATLSALLKRLFSAQAKSTLQQNISTEYSNVTMDSEGFIYGTISQLKAEDLSSHFKSKTELGAAFRKLNAAGSDVLQRDGLLPPSGDQGDDTDRSTYSYIVDATVSKNGLSSILDSQKGRVFTYTRTGELLYVFGGIGERQNKNSSTTTTTTTVREEQIGYSKGTSLAPVALELLLDDETIVVLDSTGCQFTTYVPTEYGKTLREAVNAHEERRYEDAVASWNEILGQSSNSSIAYRGVGKVFYLNASDELDDQKQKETYMQAADYFQKGYSQEEYGKAFYKYRDKVLEEIMPYLLTGIIVLVAVILIFGWTKKFKKFIKTKGRPE